MGDASAKDGQVPRSGQASGPGLFGLPGNGNLFRRCPSQEGTRTAPQGQVADHQPSCLGGLTFGERKARISHLLAPVRPVTAPRPEIASARSAVAMTLLLAKDRARQEAAALTAQVELSASERISVSRYLESLERDEEERSAREGTTPFMLSCAAASDMREAFATCFDEQEAVQAGFHFAADPLDPALAHDN